LMITTAFGSVKQRRDPFDEKFISQVRLRANASTVWCTVKKRLPSWARERPREWSSARRQFLFFPLIYVKARAIAYTVAEELTLPRCWLERVRLTAAPYVENK